ncbi:ribosomal RNA-processing protein 7-domain-containing protein [Mycena sp. CBHHK59/15]|nr:ribosomal RNA-processing protein 7-domain-containing protein [Mycena sp. CBHHK59/15]
MSVPSSVAGFATLPVSYSGSTHYLYARSHTGSKKNASKTLPEGRTLFLVNVPPDATERELVLLFKSCGTVEQVVFDLDAQETLAEPDDSDEEEKVDQEADNGLNVDIDAQPHKRRKLDTANKSLPPKIISLPSKLLRRLRNTGRSAHLIFLDASSMERALAPQPKTRLWPTSEEPSGITHYTALFDSLRPPLDAVREHADTAMELFEFQQKQNKQKSQYRKGEAIVDEDGFTLVTRGGAYGQTLGGGVAVASKKFQESGETRTGNKKKEPKQKAGFYAFQKAERQRNGMFCNPSLFPRHVIDSRSPPELMELKKNWEADKAKVEKLKTSRRFKPY